MCVCVCVHVCVCVCARIGVLQGFFNTVEHTHVAVTGRKGTLFHCKWLLCTPL